MSALDFIVLALATWRLAFFVSHDDAPFRVMARIRARVPAAVGLGCVRCMSIWAALLMLVIWNTDARVVVYVAAMSGGALMLASYSGVNHGS